MIPTLAMYTTAFGPASTWLAILIGVFWIWAIARRYPLNQPLLRIIGVVLLAISLSMALGFNQTHDPRFEHGGGFGGLIGRWVADRILAFDVPFVTGLVVTLLVFAVLASLVLATEWLLIPLHFRRQQAQYATAGMDASALGLSNPPTAVHRTATTPGGSAPFEEDDSTVDPLGGGGAATATLERDEVMPPSRRAVSGGMVFGAQDIETLPLGEGRTFAPEGEATGADVPWYMRRRARREAEAAERASQPGDEAAPESAQEFDVTPRARRRREDDSAENEAPTQDLTENLAESVGSSFATESPPIPEVDEAMMTPPPEAMVAEAAPIVDAPNAFAAEPVADPTPASGELESRDDSFADFLASSNEAAAIPAEPEIVRASEAPPVAEPEPLRAPEEPIVEATVEPSVEVSPEPERTIEPIVEVLPETSVAESAPPEPEVEQPAPPRAAPLDDPEQVLFLTAGDAVVSGQRASISFLQRTLSIGYFQAAKLLDRLEREGVIGPYTGAVSRNVVMSPADWTKKKG
jgi:Ftsk gamma domain/4TM region of DNA translocase FtsK/SpoIIIE